MDFTKYNCPFCGQAFKETDDVVVCPDCGTPHHRECWLKNGECFRADKHGLNEPVEVEFKDVEENENANNINGEQAFNGGSSGFSDYGQSNNGFNQKNQEKEPPQKIVQDIMDRLKNNSQEEVVIDSHKLSLFAAAIGKNQDYYLPRFMLFEKMKKPFAWNIGGCFFPLAWALYRKMYKIAALVFALYIAVFAMSSLPLVTNEEYIEISQVCLQEDPQYALNVLMFQAGYTDVTLTANQVKYCEVLESIEIPLYTIIFSYIVTLGTRIAMGFFGSYLYFKKLSKNISKAKEKTKITGMPEETLKMYLYKKFGTFPFIICAIIGFIEFKMF